MGDYATTTSIAVLLPSFLKGDTTTVDENGKAIFSAHITRAESLVNSVVAIRYSLPFIVGTATTNVPPLLRTLTEDIAVYYSLRGTLTQDGKQKNQYLIDFERAISVLDAIGAGTMALVDTTGAQVTPISTSRFKTNTRTYTPIFGLDSSTSWGRDVDEIADTKAARDQT